jgi:hypothetical protein
MSNANPFTMKLLSKIMSAPTTTQVRMYKEYKVIIVARMCLDCLEH